MTQSQDDIRRAYDLASETYAREFVDELEYKPADVTLLKKFASMVGPGGSVLDLGCGPGHTTAHLDSLGLSTLGVDLSPEMIRNAKSLFPRSKFEVADIFDLDFDDSSFDGILAFYCIVNMQTEQLKPAFVEMNRVLVENGVILLAFHVGEERIRVESFLETDAALEFSAFLTSEVSKALISAGFVDLEIHERSPYEREYPSTRGYIFSRKPKIA